MRSFLGEGENCLRPSQGEGENSMRSFLGEGENCLRLGIREVEIVLSSLRRFPSLALARRTSIPFQSFAGVVDGDLGLRNAKASSNAA
jgi:hypothetical protein